tara:strand:- start:190 stop:567 length:378 start_codon:yes stop_codon:yes gene_type:complete
MAKKNYKKTPKTNTGDIIEGFGFAGGTGGKIKPGVNRYGQDPKRMIKAANWVSNQLKKMKSKPSMGDPVKAKSERARISMEGRIRAGIDAPLPKPKKVSSFKKTSNRKYRKPPEPEIGYSDPIPF